MSTRNKFPQPQYVPRGVYLRDVVSRSALECQQDCRAIRRGKMNVSSKAIPACRKYIPIRLDEIRFLNGNPGRLLSAAGLGYVGIQSGGHGDANNSVKPCSIPRMNFVEWLVRQLLRPNDLIRDGDTSRANASPFCLHAFSPEPFAIADKNLMALCYAFGPFPTLSSAENKNCHPLLHFTVA